MDLAIEALGISFAFLTLLGGLIMTWTRLNTTIQSLSNRVDNLERTISTLETNITRVDKELNKSIVKLTEVAISAQSSMHEITGKVQSLVRLLEVHTRKFEEYDKSIISFFQDYDIKKKS